jgi:hypothetical protein
MKKLAYLLTVFPMLMLSAQNIGINTTSPQAKLHVVGNFKFEPNTSVSSTRLVGVSSDGLVKEFPLSETFEIINDSLTVVKVPKDNIYLVGDVDQSGTAATTNQYNNFDLGIEADNSNHTIIRITGETNGYSVTGFQDGFDGRVIYFYNAQNNNVTFMNLNAGSDTDNQIITTTGSNEGISNQGVAEFIYDGSIGKWILINIRS